MRTASGCRWQGPGGSWVGKTTVKTQALQRKRPRGDATRPWRGKNMPFLELLLNRDEPTPSQQIVRGDVRVGIGDVVLIHDRRLLVGNVLHASQELGLGLLH